MIKRKGIILAGGSGTRLHPVTLSVSKQLLPLYNKPTIFYSLSILMLSGIREILLITNKEYLYNYKKLLGNGEEFGISISYKIQKKPNGIAEAFIIGEKFIDNNYSALILGDNFFYGKDLYRDLKNISNLNSEGCHLFIKRVKKPEHFGVLKFNKKDEVVSIVEKPKKFISNYAITGLYFYDPNVLNYVKDLKISKRGELEISDLNKIYLSKKEIKFTTLNRSTVWFDSGTFEGLNDASNFIRITENNSDQYIASLHEIAYKNKWISSKKLSNIASLTRDSQYSNYLFSLINEN